MGSDVIPAVAFASFGLWWLLFPRSVLHFYGVFHRGRVASPKPAGIRLAGGLWVALVVAVVLSRLLGS